MSNTVTIKNGKSIYSGKLILTNYGRTRVLQRIALEQNFVTFNFTHIGIGDLLSNTYTQNISYMGNEVLSFEISKENVTLSDYTAIIETNVDIDKNIAIQEIGLYETIDNRKRLFAYASGFSILKGDDLSYDLTIDLSLAMGFENEHYSRMSVSLDDSEYALMPVMSNMFDTLTKSQLDLERSVEINARELGYNQAQSFMLEQQRMSKVLQNIFLLGRYEKAIVRLKDYDMTDCFLYPEVTERNYILKNLVDTAGALYQDDTLRRYELVTEGNEIYFVDEEGHKYKKVSAGNGGVKYNDLTTRIGSNTLPHTTTKGILGIFLENGNFREITEIPASQMSITGDLQLCNRDNIDLSHEMSIIYTTHLNKMDKESIILGKINPNEDEYYFDLRVVYDKNRAAYGIQFTIYSYDIVAAKRGTYSDERNLVGHYRVKYFPTSAENVRIVQNETMFSFVYNGDIDNPEIKMYIDTELVNNKEGFIVDNFNYMGPCKDFKDKCTLRNYSQTSSLETFEKPMYYLIPEIKNSSIMVFGKVLNEDDIKYISLISKS